MDQIRLVSYGNEENMNAQGCWAEQPDLMLLWTITNWLSRDPLAYSGPGKCLQLQQHLSEADINLR